MTTGLQGFFAVLCITCDLFIFHVCLSFSICRLIVFYVRVRNYMTNQIVAENVNFLGGLPYFNFYAFFTLKLYFNFYTIIHIYMCST